MSSGGFTIGHSCQQSPPAASEMPAVNRAIAKIRDSSPCQGNTDTQRSTAMELWWQALNLELQVFYGIGILALLALALQLVLLLFGGFDDGLDLGDGADHGSGLGLFSFRGITAFFVGFGWTGTIALKAGHSLALAIILGLLVGGALMVAIFLLMRSMMRLQ